MKVKVQSIKGIYEIEVPQGYKVIDLLNQEGINSDASVVFVNGVKRLLSSELNDGDVVSIYPVTEKA